MDTQGVLSSLYISVGTYENRMMLLDKRTRKARQSNKRGRIVFAKLLGTEKIIMVTNHHLDLKLREFQLCMT